MRASTPLLVRLRLRAPRRDAGLGRFRAADRGPGQNPWLDVAAVGKVICRLSRAGRRLGADYGATSP
jgi:hypothetical protein